MQYFLSLARKMSGDISAMLNNVLPLRDDRFSSCREDGPVAFPPSERMAAAVASASEQISLPPVTVPGSANANSMTAPSSAPSPPTSNAASSAPQQPAPATVDRSAQTGDIVQLDRVEDALEAFRRGEFVVVVDDMDRENEGDLIIAAEHVSQQQMAWLIRHSSSVPRRVEFCAGSRRS